MVTAKQLPSILDATSYSKRASYTQVGTLHATISVRDFQKTTSIAVAYGFLYRVVSVCPTVCSVFQSQNLYDFVRCVVRKLGNIQEILACCLALLFCTTRQATLLLYVVVSVVVVVAVLYEGTSVSWHASQTSFLTVSLCKSLRHLH